MSRAAPTQPTDWQRRAEAADAEIGRLRHQIGVEPGEELPDAPDQGWCNYTSDVEHLHKLAEDECDRLKARVGELEAALSEAMTMLDKTVYAEACPPGWAERVDAVQAALKGHRPNPMPSEPPPGFAVSEKTEPRRPTTADMSDPVKDWDKRVWPKEDSAKGDEAK